MSSGVSSRRPTLVGERWNKLQLLFAKVVPWLNDSLAQLEEALGPQHRLTRDAFRRLETSG